LAAVITQLEADIDDIAYLSYLSAVYIMYLFFCSDNEFSTGIACTTSQTAV
jgi:hypothetical protein